MEKKTTQRIMNNSKKIYLLIFAVIALYSIWNGRNLILGPHIKIISPINGSQVDQNPIIIEGTARNVSFISINGREIYVDKGGNFKEVVVLTTGENSLEVFAKDRFNKEKIERIYLYNSTQN